MREDGTWSDWTSLEMLNPGSEGEGTEAGTEPVLSLGADGIQARVLTASGQTPANLKINLVAAGTSATDGKLKAALPLPPPPPPTAPRSSRPSSPGPNGVPRKSQANTTARRSAKLQAMYVHHTASSNKYTEKPRRPSRSAGSTTTTPRS